MTTKKTKNVIPDNIVYGEETYHYTTSDGRELVVRKMNLLPAPEFRKLIRQNISDGERADRIQDAFIEAIVDEDSEQVYNTMSGIEFIQAIKGWGEDPDVESSLGNA